MGGGGRAQDMNIRICISGSYYQSQPISWSHDQGEVSIWVIHDHSRPMRVHNKISLELVLI